jgi:hypothetical protein
METQIMNHSLFRVRSFFMAAILLLLALPGLAQIGEPAPKKTVTQPVTGLVEMDRPGPAFERQFKKKVVATAFAVNRPAQVGDIDDIAHGFPRELLRRLENSRLFLTRSSPNLLSFTLEQEVPGIALIRQVAAENDSQFVIAGAIRNAGVLAEQKYLGLWTTRKRMIEIEFVIYDGASGALIASHVLATQAGDQAMVGRDKPFGSAAFYASSYGKTIDGLLNDAVKKIVSDLQTRPMLSKILKINKGQITLDAGASSAIASGDLADVVAAANDLPVLGFRANQSQPLTYGVMHSSPGKLTIVQVQDLFSVAKFAEEVKTEEVKVGDLVRFDFDTAKQATLVE